MNSSRSATPPVLEAPSCRCFGVRKYSAEPETSAIMPASTLYSRYDSVNLSSYSPLGSGRSIMNGELMHQLQSGRACARVLSRQSQMEDIQSTWLPTKVPSTTSAWSSSARKVSVIQRTSKWCLISARRESSTLLALWATTNYLQW